MATMRTQSNGSGESASEALDRSADSLRRAMARLRERVAAVRRRESAPDAGLAAESVPPGSESPEPAVGQTLLHLLPRVGSVPQAPETPAPATAPALDAARPRADAVTVRLAQDILVLAYRSACQSLFACAVENERRLAEAQAAADRIRATANAAAAVPLRQAEVENARRLQEVQRRSEALVKVVQAQLRSLGFGPGMELPLLDTLALPAHLQADLSRTTVDLRPAGDAPPRGRGGASPEYLAPGEPGRRVRGGELWPAPPTEAPRARQVVLSPAPSRADAPAAPPPAADEPAVVTPGEPLPLGSTELVAGPFARFSQLAAFTQALNALPGVQSVATRQFYRGKVHFRVRYDGPIPLTVAIADLSAFHPQIVSDNPGRVEVRVMMDSPPEETAPHSQARR
jgi:hypothetical protein